MLGKGLLTRRGQFGSSDCNHLKPVVIFPFSLDIRAGCLCWWGGTEGGREGTEWMEAGGRAGKHSMPMRSAKTGQRQQEEAEVGQDSSW